MNTNMATGRNMGLYLTHLKHTLSVLFLPAKANDTVSIILCPYIKNFKILETATREQFYPMTTDEGTQQARPYAKLHFTAAIQIYT